MRTTRHDAWKSREDALLLNIVLKTIRNGNTQKYAFEQIHKALPHRTIHAINFRFNAVIRPGNREIIRDSMIQGRKMRQATLKVENQLNPIENPVNILNEAMKLLKLLPSMEQYNERTDQLAASEQYVKELETKVDALTKLIVDNNIATLGEIEKIVLVEGPGQFLDVKKEEIK